MSTAEQTPLRYRGQANKYVDVAKRGTDEYLGLSVEYAVHPSNIGCFIVRFVAHGSGVEKQNYTHLTYREKAQFLVPESDGKSAEVINGVRLNKIAIPVFKPGVQRRELVTFATKFNSFGKLSSWIADQILAEGFTPIGSIREVIKEMLIPKPTPEDSVTNVIEFPDLASPEQKYFAQQQVSQQPDDEDGDEDEKKGWVN